MILIELIFKQSKSIQVVHYATHRLDETQIELISWQSMFDFIHRFSSNFDHVNAIQDIQASIPEHVCEHLFSSPKLSLKAYLDFINLSERTFYRYKSEQRDAKKIERHKRINAEDIKKGLAQYD